MTTQVFARKADPALWELVGGHWRMRQAYAELWEMYLAAELTEKQSQRRQQEMIAAYDGDEPPF